ncbi:MAG TPA: Gfo/Idh/MocA family oxidoreductase [Fontimonas sp.]
MSFALLEASAAGRQRPPVAVGVIGCGVISNVFMKTIAHSGVVRLKSCASATGASAAVQAKKFDTAAVSVDALLADPEIEVVLNLTPPNAHFDICRRALEAGKHVFSEKPLTPSLAEARELARIAAQRGLRIGCAPDTFLGSAHQCARRTIDAGTIGRIVGGTLTVASRGMEHWHPNPAWFYQRGGGPVLDVGIYPVTQLVNLLGPVERVIAFASRPSARRLISSQPLAGTHFDVEVPTTYNGALYFVSGANVALTMSWDVWKHQRQPIELYGEEGSLLNPDPNFFTGTVQISRRNGEWMPADGQGEDAALDNDFKPLGGPRGLGLIDLVLAVERGRVPRTDISLAIHVLEVLLAIEQSAVSGRALSIESTVERPAAL